MSEESLLRNHLPEAKDKSPAPFKKSIRLPGVICGGKPCVTGRGWRLAQARAFAVVSQWWCPCLETMPNVWPGALCCWSWCLQVRHRKVVLILSKSLKILYYFSKEERKGFSASALIRFFASNECDGMWWLLLLQSLLHGVSRIQVSKSSYCPHTAQWRSLADL